MNVAQLRDVHISSMKVHCGFNVQYLSVMFCRIKLAVYMSEGTSVRIP